MKLALLLLAALASPAFADQPRVCWCATPHSLPATGSVDVPLNAHFWRVPSTEPGREIQSYALSAHTGYVLQDTSFTTGGDVDHEPPLPPTLGAASITLRGTAKAERSPVSVLHLTAQASSDTAVLRIDMIDALGEVTYYTTPSELSICDPLIALEPGHIRVTITAYDLAGNASSSDWLDAEATTDQHAKPTCTHAVASVVADADGDVAAFLVAVGLAGLVVLFSRMYARVRMRTKTVQAAFALPAVEQLARAVRRRMLAIVVGAGIATSFALHDHVIAIYLLAVSPVALALTSAAVITYIRAGSVLALLRYEGASATVQHDVVFVRVGKNSAGVAVPPGLLERARHHAIPKATL